MPQEHLDFLKNLEPFWENDSYIFVHAGLEPNLPVAQNDISTLCEARDIFFSVDHDFGKKVIFGHTAFSLPLVTSTKIGIDTGAVFGNLLTAIELACFAFNTSCFTFILVSKPDKTSEVSIEAVPTKTGCSFFLHH